MSEPSQNNPPTNTGSRRRVRPVSHTTASALSTNAAQSSSWMPAFEALQNQKRSNSDMLRRQSMSDQHVKGGMFSQFFHNNFGRNAK
ncbi:hypothetical protein E4U53_006787 [Claviceps sorghi]|nr:hypothetical protein E4U53_006787 [Claviceps sorghi]